ncbi:MAG: hypothetical protein ACFFBJ_04765 [Promethearchaeota archaeon]
MRSTAIIISMGFLNILLFDLATNLDFFFILLGSQLILTALLVKSEELSRRGYFIALLFGLIARLLFITKRPLLSFDAIVYSQFARRMMAGEVPYLDFYFPYPLAVALLFAAIYFVFSSPFAFKIAFSLIDILNALIIPRIIPDGSARNYGLIASAVYLLVPVTIIEAAWNGHFESVIILFMLLSVYFFLRGHNWKALLFAGVGALIKYVPIGISIGIFRATKGATRRLLVLLFAAATFLLGYLSMILIGSRVTVLIQGSPTRSTPFYDYSFPAFFRIVTGLTGIIGEFGLILIGGLLFLAILAEKRFHDEIVPRFVKYSLFIILVVVGLGLTLYPMSSMYSQNYWRRLPEICFAQGVSILLVCSVLVSKWDSLSFNEDIHLILFVLLLLMFYQPVFYAWYILFLFPIALLFRPNETRVFLIVCLLLYPTASVGVFSPAAAENSWFFGSDISQEKLNDANILFSTHDNQSTTISAADGILSYRTNSSTTQGYSTRIQWNVTNLHIAPKMILQTRMISSADPTWVKPFRISLVSGVYNSSSGEYDEQSLITNITFISNMTWITYHYQLHLQQSITPDYITLVVQVVGNVTGMYDLYIDSFLIVNDLNTPSPIWFVSIPLSLIGMTAPVLIMFPGTFSEFYYALRRIWLRLVARIKRAKLHLGPRVKLCRGSRVILERESHLSIEGETEILGGTEIIVHSKASIKIGHNVFISRMCTISAHESVEIRDNTSIGAFSFILDTNKVFDDAQKDIRGQGYSCKPISIGDDVWLGAHVVILPGSSIGAHSVVGANSTVRDEFPENSVIAGNPAEMIRTRGERRE